MVVARMPTAVTASAPMVATGALVVDELSVVRRGVRLLLETLPGIDVVGEASTPEEAEEASIDPDLVVHELLFPAWTPAEVVTRLQRRFPEARLLVLSRLDHPSYVHLAMAKGVAGYVTKAASATELLEAVTTVTGGGEYVEPLLGASLARWGPGGERRGRAEGSELTVREMEVAQLVALGHTSNEIADALGIAPRTVEAHRAHIGQKLGVRSRADVVRFVESWSRSGRRGDGP